MAEDVIDIPLPGEPRNTLVIRLRKRRDAADTYQARRLVPIDQRRNARNPYVTKNLGTSDLDTAKMLAVQWERGIKSKIDQGQSLHPLPFREVAGQYLQDAKTRANILDARGNPLVAKSSLTRDESVIRRYLIPFFGDVDIREISTRMCDRYLAWRSDYYISGPGKDEHEITYERSGSVLQRPAARNPRPASSTINKDSVAFNKVLQFARRTYDLPDLNGAKIKPPKAGSNKARRRPRFYDDELELLLTNATEQCVMSTGRTAHCRMMLWAFIELMLGTGIRVSEAYWLQAKHLEFRPISDIRQEEYDSAPETWEDEGLLAFKYLALPTQDGKLMGFRVRVAADNPGLKDIDHARLVIPAFYYSEVLYQHLAYLAGHIEKITGQTVEDPLELPPEQFLFVNYDGSRTKSLRNGFQSLLDSSNSSKYPKGLRMREGKTRPLTSLRHTYASKQIEAGATANGLGFLADNMGTSTEMLRKHYAQVLNELKADDLQKY